MSTILNMKPRAGDAVRKKKKIRRIDPIYVAATGQSVSALYKDNMAAERIVKEWKKIYVNICPIWVTHEESKIKEHVSHILVLYALW